MFTAEHHRITQFPAYLMLGGGKLIHVPKSGKEVFVVAIALHEAREEVVSYAFGRANVA